MDDTTERFIQAVKAFVINCWEWLIAKIKWFSKETVKAEIDADFGVTVFLALLILFVLGSAFWSASIAASRRHRQIPHFVLGLLFPWVYPLIILFKMGIKGEKEALAKMAEKEAAAKEREDEKKKNIELNTGGEAASEAAAPEESVWTQKHFAEIARKPDGTPAGPWEVTYAGGIHVHVTQIIEALPQVVHVEFTDDKGKAVRMRIPYARIESWDAPEHQEQ